MMKRDNTMMYDSVKAHEAQEQFCKDHNVPLFVPGPREGYLCYRCNHDIYSVCHAVVLKDSRGDILNSDTEVPGISVEEAGSRLITGCPFCHASFVD